MEIQEITGVSTFGDISFTKDFQTLVILDYSQYFRVYKKDLSGYVLKEDVSFSPYYGSIIRVVQDQIILAGIS